EDTALDLAPPGGTKVIVGAAGVAAVEPDPVPLLALEVGPRADAEVQPGVRIAVYIAGVAEAGSQREALGLPPVIGRGELFFIHSLSLLYSSCSLDPFLAYRFQLALAPP